MQPADGRKFNDQEVALIIKRAAELQQTEQLEQEPANAMTLGEIEQIARQHGMRTMYEDGIVKALAGETTIEEVLRVTEDA